MKKILFTAILLATTGAFSQVGIGTTDPKGALDIVSSTGGLIIPRVADHTTLTVAAAQTGMQVYNTTTKSIWLWDGTAWVVASNQPNKFVDGTTATDAVFTGGKVGVGTTTPSAALDVVSTGTDGTTNALEVNSSTNQLLVIKDDGTSEFGNTTGNYRHVRLITGDRIGKITTSTSLADNSFILGLQTSDANSRIKFVLGDLPAVVIDAKGNHRYETPTAGVFNLPAARSRLDINGYLTLGSSDVTADAALAAGMVRYNGGLIQYHDGAVWNTVATSAGSVDTSADAWADNAGNIVMTSGNVGIGTTTAPAKLTVRDYVAGNFLEFQRSGTLKTQMIMDSGGLFYIVADSFRIGRTTSSGDLVIADTTGNVGIGVGTATPSAKLEVAGSIKVGNDGDTATNGTIRYNSTTNKFQGYANGAWVDLH